ncbi:phage tail tube protein [Pseudoroseomonas cervicalis]|uniref:phage tail tube protein n=1 Tax=Teichococcus cervicalis TaxID=204525 RepID=UPI0022F1DA88|nr:phage tail tube protein [Pseudoroseomonas cervicalis]WBV42729.1 phage tail tube protein [Pseudoroseomonas cervicalis]
MADNSRRRGGVAWLWVDGMNFEVVSEPTWGVSSVTRQTLASMSGISGYSETPKAGFIAATIRDTAGMRVKDFEEMTNVSVTLRLASGKEIYGTGMWTVEAPEVNATEGTFAIRFEGEDVRES